MCIHVHVKGVLILAIHFSRGTTQDGFSDQIFRICVIFYFGFIVAIFDLVSNVEAI